LDIVEPENLVEIPSSEAREAEDLENIDSSYVDEEVDRLTCKKLEKLKELLWILTLSNLRL
jgi:hypothetical protein